MSGQDEPPADRIRARLAQAQTRAEAREILAGERKADLLEFAAARDVAVSSRDNLARITHRITEATVGAQADADAIGNTDLRSPLTPEHPGRGVEAGS